VQSGILKLPGHLKCGTGHLLVVRHSAHAEQALELGRACVCPAVHLLHLSLLLHVLLLVLLVLHLHLVLVLRLLHLHLRLVVLLVLVELLGMHLHLLLVLLLVLLQEHLLPQHLLLLLLLLLVVQLVHLHLRALRRRLQLLERGGQLCACRPLELLLGRRHGCRPVGVGLLCKCLPCQLCLGLGKQGHEVARGGRRWLGRCGGRRAEGRRSSTCRYPRPPKVYATAAVPPIRASGLGQVFIKFLQQAAQQVGHEIVNPLSCRLLMPGSSLILLRWRGVHGRLVLRLRGASRGGGRALLEEAEELLRRTLVGGALRLERPGSRGRLPRKLRESEGLADHLAGARRCC
jgi:hypothetical protein